MTTEVEKETLDQLVLNASFVADEVGMSLAGSRLPPAEVTGRELRAGLELLIGNGLIKVVPMEEWPEYIKLTPPYDKRPFES